MRRNKGKKPPRYKHRIDQYRSLWSKWNGMKRRCLSEEGPRYKDYGGRGIKIYQPWLDSFDNFADWALTHGYEDGLTIERIDVNGDYCPENCKWITLVEQRFNTRNTIWVDYRGRHIQLAKLCMEKGKSYDTIHNRITKMGWNAERAIDEPITKKEDSLRHKCTERGLSYETVRDRIIKLGWSEEEALSTPTGRGKGCYLCERKIKCICALCGKEFIKTTGRQKYCSAECRESAKRTNLRNIAKRINSTCE